MTSAFGRAKRLPLVPAERTRAAAGSGDADADRRDVILDMLHRVHDGQSRRDRPAGRIDVERDLLLGIFGLQEEELGDDQVGEVVVDRAAQKDDVVLQKARVDVVRALAGAGFFDDGGDEHGKTVAFFKRKINTTEKIALRKFPRIKFGSIIYGTWA